MDESLVEKAEMSGKWAEKRERARGANAAHKNENKPRSVGDKMCPSLSRLHFTFGLFRVGVNIDSPLLPHFAALYDKIPMLREIPLRDGGRLDFCGCGQ